MASAQEGAANFIIKLLRRLRQKISDYYCLISDAAA